MIITDILILKLDGFALVQRLRTDTHTRSIPIILLSATYVTPNDKAFAFKLGETRFLEKPVDTEDFLLTVAEVLTDGPFDISPPLGMSEFYKDYRARLESKLRHKSKQITRTERWLETIPDEQ